MKIKMVIESIPKIYDFRFRKKYSRHVAMAMPHAIARRAAEQTNASFWGAIVNFEEAKRGKKGNPAV